MDSTRPCISTYLEVPRVSSNASAKSEMFSDFLGIIGNLSNFNIFSESLKTAL